MASISNWATVADIPIEKPPQLGLPLDGKPDDDDLGFNDPHNIIFINMKSAGLGARLKDDIQEHEKMLQLTHQLAMIHSGIQVKKRKQDGSLPADHSDDSRWKRSQYRARVIEAYLNDGVYPWIQGSRRNVIEKQIDVDKSRFHWELLATMLAELVLPRPVSADLEAIFQSISDTISDTKYADGARSFWALSQVLTYDEIRDSLQTSLRNITYTLDHDMHTILKTKKTLDTIKVRFSFDQNDFSFNIRTWYMMQPEVEKFLQDTGASNIKDTFNVHV